MATRLPPVHALSAFEAAARHSSFAIAAEELCITPSALSHRIRLLEEHLCERVFVREGRSVTLTEFGRRYLDVVRVALRTLSDFPLPNKITQSQLRVKVTVPPTFARYMFMPRLAEFMRQYPDIEIEVYLFVPLYDLSLSESDVEVRFGAGEYPNLVTKKLFVEPSFAVASPAYLKSLPSIQTPADLRHARLLRSALEPWQPWFEVAGLDWPEPTTGLRIDDLGLLLEAVKHGHGIGLTRQHFAQEMINRGEVVRVFDTQLATPPHAYYLVHEAQANIRPEVALFIDWMQATYQQA
ncbi:transcriptional regulator [Undibacterium sp. YM2]|jgi:LysR family glycine cleavage system transcriptional activator|uniref:LysR substrate-binding domain-containing protein n=1 Tax=Undibacterium sp. YM2 TaxID=2058625 RepID=UPI001331D456|nr:LysR substrate-binding domain-containing protein [Undibacterium sp. YM2]BBB68984.1 transcriptional regulator [Undibacterium sp. YM2]